MWNIQNQHLSLREWPLELAFDELNFKESPFWVQVHELPAIQFN